MKNIISKLKIASATLALAFVVGASASPAFATVSVSPSLANVNSVVSVSCSSGTVYSVYDQNTPNTPVAHNVACTTPITLSASAYDATSGKLEVLEADDDLGTVSLAAAKADADYVASANLAYARGFSANSTSTIGSGLITNFTGLLTDNIPTVLTFVAGVLVLFMLIAWLKRGAHGH